jgi:hypothetical protein
VAYTVVFLWISAAGAGNATITSAELRALRDFGAARGISLREVGTPAASPSVAEPGLPAYDSQLADRLEGELEQARTALSALEEDAASTRLARVESELLAHPHLPQAAFLMAECLAQKAALTLPRDAARASALERWRGALEGKRAPAFGDSAPSEPEPATHAVRITGQGVTDRIELDGRELDTAQVSLAPGLHHVRVWRAGRPIFASFERLEPGQRELPLAAPKLLPCSRDDLAVGRDTDGRHLPAAIACERWALVRSEPGGIGVASCQKSRCGAFTHWQARSAQPFAPLAVTDSRLPAWATFALAGAAAVAATSVVLWQAGAFDSDSGRTSTFRYAGVDAQGIRF